MDKRVRGQKKPMDRQDIKRMLRILRKEIPSPKFKCYQCGKCCGPVFLLRTEMVQILNHITDYKLWGEVLMMMKSRLEGKTPDERVMCPLLRTLPDGKTECMVYRVRPIVCRLQGVERELPCPNNQAGYPLWNKSKYIQLYYDLMVDHKTTIADGLAQGLRILRKGHQPPTPDPPQNLIVDKPTEKPLESADPKP